VGRAQREKVCFAENAIQGFQVTGAGFASPRSSPDLA